MKKKFSISLIAGLVVVLMAIMAIFMPLAQGFKDDNFGLS
jgi:flagellar basal body-associated protein FliL